MTRVPILVILSSLLGQMALMMFLTWAFRRGTKSDRICTIIANDGAEKVIVVRSVYLGNVRHGRHGLVGDN